LHNPLTVKKEHISFKTRTQIEMQSMVWPGLIFLFIFAYIPMYGITIAFREYNIFTGLKGSPWVGLKYFREFFSDPNFFNVMRNTLVLNIAGLIVGFPAPIILAILICELKNSRFKKIAQTISYLPHFLSWVIFGGIAIEMLSPNGIISHFLFVCGAQKEPVNFMAKSNLFPVVYVILTTLKDIGFSSILYIAAISGIDQEMFEAAEIDGASRAQQIWYLTLPAILGTIVIMLIFSLSAILNTGVEQFLVLQNGINLSWSETIDTYVYKVGLQQARYSYAGAVGFFKSVVSVIMLAMANKISNKLTGKGLF
jgi:putative aldouronate transport system permease protein